MLLLRAVHDVAECEHVGHERDDRHGQVHVRIVHRLHGELGLILEHGEHLREHAPDGERVGAVLNPAALVPEEVRHGRGEQQREAAIPGVGRQAVVGVAEVPNIVCDDEYPSHVRPQHVLLLL